MVTPADWADAGMAAGTPFAAAHTLRQTGPFRPGEPAPDTVQCGLRRVGHAARRRRADGADLRPAGGAARHRSAHDDGARGAPRRAGRPATANPVGAATVADAHDGAGPAAPGVLRAARRRRRPAPAAAPGGGEDPVRRCAGPTPAAGTRRPARTCRRGGRTAARRGARPRAPSRSTEVGVYVYRAADAGTGRVEHEYDHVLVGRVPAGLPLRPDPAEVAELRWIAIDDLLGGDPATSRRAYAPGWPACWRSGTTPSRSPPVADEGLTAGAVARRLGVAVTTLRTWHQRYELGPSAHEPGQHRRYTDEDVARLELMQRLTADGVPPGEAARWVRERPMALTARLRTRGRPPATRSVRRPRRPATVAGTTCRCGRRRRPRAGSAAPRCGWTPSRCGRSRPTRSRHLGVVRRLGHRAAAGARARSASGTAAPAALVEVEHLLSAVRLGRARRRCRARRRRARPGCCSPAPTRSSTACRSRRWRRRWPRPACRAGCSARGCRPPRCAPPCGAPARRPCCCGRTTRAPPAVEPVVGAVRRPHPADAAGGGRPRLAGRPAAAGHRRSADAGRGRGAAPRRCLIARPKRRPIRALPALCHRFAGLNHGIGDVSFS